MLLLYTYCINKDYTRIPPVSRSHLWSVLLVYAQKNIKPATVTVYVWMYCTSIQIVLFPPEFAGTKVFIKKYKMLSIRRKEGRNFVIENFGAADFKKAPVLYGAVWDVLVRYYMINDSQHVLYVVRSRSCSRQNTRDHAKKKKKT